MKRKILFGLSGLALYCVVLAFAPLVDRLILFPTTHRIEAGKATRKSVPYSGGEIEVWRAASRLAHRTGRTELYALRFYGNADRAEYSVADEAEMWNGRAVEVWGVNYPGYGGSTGPARLARMAPAALAAFDAIQEVAKDRPIVVFGTSLGTTVALNIAVHRPVAGLILQNPPPIREMIHRHLGWWNLRLLSGPLARKVPAALESVANARAARVPAIFLLADQDEVVAPHFQALVVKAYGGARRVIHLPGADHNSPIDHAGLTKLYEALDWLLPRNSGAGMAR